jgi:hypothetical protein
LIDSETRFLGDAILLPEVANRLRDSERNMTPQNGVRDFTNRNLRENSKQTGQMVMDIKEGNFFPTLLSFDWNGKIQNAQHRCFAIEQSDEPVIVMVETRANPKAFFSHDCGNQRSFADNAITGFLQHWRNKDGGYLGTEKARKGIMNRICSIGERSMALLSPDATGRVGSRFAKFNASFTKKEEWFEANKDSLIFAVNIWRSQVERSKDCRSWAAWILDGHSFDAPNQPREGAGFLPRFNSRRKREKLSRLSTA